MNLVDLVLILVIAVVAIASARKGFLMTLFNITSYVISGFAAKIFASPVATYAYENFFGEKIINELYKIMPTGSVEGEISTVVGDVLESLPSYIQAMVSHFGVFDMTSTGTTSTLTVEMIESTYLAPIVMKVLSIVATVILFVILVCLLRIVFSGINKGLTKKKHKFIRGTNTFLGAAFGAVKGTGITAIFAAILNIAAPVIGNANLSQYVNESAICNIVAEILK